MLKFPNFHLIKHLAGLSRRAIRRFTDWFIDRANGFANFLERLELFFESAEIAAEQQIAMEEAILNAVTP